MVEPATASPIGGRGRRLDADDKLTGRARYASDLVLPGMLFGNIVRSDRPHARIIAIETSAAEALPGVEAVLHGDVTGGRFGEIVKDQTPFALDKVRYVGDPVAAVAADTPETAELAARLIAIEYEDLPAVFDPIAALQPDAPLVHDDIISYDGPAELIRFGNVTAQVVLTRGDTETAFAAADQIIEGTYAAHSVHQMPMETRAAVATVDARGRLTIHASTQGPFNVRHRLHEALNLPYGDIRVVAETVGGGFGSKLEASVEMYAAMLARATGHPVKIVNTREEDLSTGTPRHPATIHLRSAVLADGRIVGREAKVILDAGAYSGGSPLIAALPAMLVPGPYRIPHLKIEVLAVHTNKMAFGAYRGPSGPQTVFAVESHTDAIAKQLGIDAVAFRLMNIVDEGDSGPNGQILQGVGMREALLKAAEAIQWGTENAPSAPGLRRGKGLAAGWWTTSAGAAGCSIQMNEDGTVVVQTGASEIGTGSVMAGIAQIVAGEMGVDLADVRMVWGDTATTPADAGAQGSRTLFNMGQAAKRAAEAARGELLSRAAEILEAAEIDLEVQGGRMSVRGVPDRGITYAELNRDQMWTTEPVLAKGRFVADPTAYDPTTVRGCLLPTFNAPSFHCHAVEVEVDPDTGSTRIIDYVVAQDAGFAVAPTYVEGQMEGGAVQGIGYMLSEQIEIDDGRMLNPNLALYKVPTMLDAPAIRTIIVEAAAEHGPYGAKGVGEPPVVMPPGAIANAVTNAIGTPIRTTPYTPERVLRVIQDGEAAAAPNLPSGFATRPGQAAAGRQPE